MASFLKIRTINRADVPVITSWARQEGFAPGKGDVGIYRHTDRQGLWVGCLGGEPIGCANSTLAATRLPQCKAVVDKVNKDKGCNIKCVCRTARALLAPRGRPPD